MTRTNALVLFGLVAVPFATLPLAGQPPAKPLTVEAIYAHQPLIGTPPDEIRWSPDAKHLTYMENDELMDLDPATGQARVLVSRAKLATFTVGPDTEQDRDHRARYDMASYLWAPDAAHLLFNAKGRLWLYDLRKGASVEVGATGAASGNDPKFSPDDKSLACIRNHGLAVVRLKEPGMSMRMVAPSPGTEILNGEVDWIYLEELDARSNYFWSPDSKQLAYLEMNETAVPEYPITDWIPTHATVEEQRYPQPGDANPAVRVGVVNASGGNTVWVTLPIRAGQDYIPRFGWVDAKTLWIETLTRDQKHRDLYFADAATGQAHVVLQLADDKFFDDKYDVTVGNGAIVLTNWSDGHNHIYLYSYDQADPANAKAKLERQLTQGDFEVGEVYRVDTKAKVVDYASNEGGPLDQQLWQVSFAGERKQLSAGAGWREGNFAPAGGAFVEKQSSRVEPPTVRLCTESGRCNDFWKAKTLEPYQLRAPEQMTVKAHDGTTLYATLLLPQGATTPASVPLIVNPYGGPGSASVVNSWHDSLLFDELLAQHGFAVLHTDNRGMGRRGRAFAQAAYHNFGPVQLEDQLTVVDAALAQHAQLDPRRLGWWGWSWGGTFTLYAMTHSERFRAGIAVAPVTDWRNYDSIYTERYMSEPAKFAAGYKDFSVVNSAARLKGRLLLAHGTGDDNVHMENTVQFVQKLIEAQIPYDLQLYPRKTHSIAGGDVRTHLFNRILAHFEEYLKPPVQ
ncbi:MAG: alpha/beta fold hydrolase [Terracidiphilus sp.]